MKAEIKDRWTTALRSGEYEQGKGAFESEGKFCCLGVLCDVTAQPTTIGSRHHGNWNFVVGLLGDSYASGVLAQMNDRGDTFPEIADWIDENVPVEP